MHSSSTGWPGAFVKGAAGFLSPPSGPSTRFWQEGIRCQASDPLAAVLLESLALASPLD